MPRVVPSQVVALVDRILSQLPPSGPNPVVLSPLQAPEISTILDLISELPDEFIALSGDEYSDYLVIINALKDLLNIWQTQPSTPPFNRRAVEAAQSLKSIRDLLTN